MLTYYNEIDPKACAWLRELMKAGLIPAGDVDERSIVDVGPDDLRGYGACHFFAGIGGWAYALKLAGWPEDQEVWTGSCPCQPLSCAGLGKGHADERHLWPAFYRHIAERRTATIFGEQVASKDGREWLAGIRADLEGMGYAVGGADLCSASVGAPNIRQRLYWVAESSTSRDGRRRILGPGESDCAIEKRRSEEFAGRGANGGRMGEPIRTGSQGHAGNGDDRNEPGRERAATAGATAENGNAGGLGQPEIDGHKGQSLRANGEQAQRIEKAGFSNGRVADTSSPEFRGQPSAGPKSPDRHDRKAGFWDSAIWHPCRDGKARRIAPEPEIFPLVAGLPGRVGLLRGAGNAINPEVAAEFIRAYLEIET